MLIHEIAWVKVNFSIEVQTSNDQPTTTTNTKGRTRLEIATTNPDTEHTLWANYKMLTARLMVLSLMPANHEAELLIITDDR